MYQNNQFITLTQNTIDQDQICQSFENMLNQLSNSSIGKIEKNFVENQNNSQKSSQISKLKMRLPRRVKSVHHNSQKHSVVAFKQLVHFDYEGSESKVHQLAKRMWLKFKSSHTLNKELLSIIFGCEESEQKKMRSRISKFGFTWIEQYDKNVFKNAQNLLRDMAINQITPHHLDEHLRIRKIHQKQGFRLYMLNLLDQLRNGSIIRRLQKKKAEGITNVVITDRLIDLSY